VPWAGEQGGSRLGWQPRLCRECAVLEQRVRVLAARVRLEDGALPLVVEGGGGLVEGRLLELHPRLHCQVRACA